MEPVVVTGVGPVTSIGIGKSIFWENLLAGRSGISPVASFDTSAYPVHMGGEIHGFKLRDYVPDEGPVGRATAFALAAARLALEDGGLAPGDVRPEEAGVAMGTTSGEPNLIEQFNDAFLADDLARAGPAFIANYPCHGIPARVAASLNFCGTAPVMIPAACAAGNYAIAHAFDLLRRGRVKVMLAGGSDSFSRITYSGFARLMAIAPDLPRPFDKNRKGMIPGEGAGFLLLESLSHARARGADIYAEIAGYGLSCDAYHMTGGHPDGLGAMAAMEMALRESGLTPDQVSYISAHGTGTPSNDRNETTAIKGVFGEGAYKVPVSSIKSMLGHTMGAASALEAAVCALAIREGRIPATTNLEEADPACDLDYVANQSRAHKVDVAMNNAYAFGGANASLILKRFRG